MRTIVDIPSEDLERLAKVCDREGVSRAEAVRRAVKGYVQSALAAPADADVFGLWKDRRIRSVDWQRKRRAEWERG
jgi:hypothetical protein